jgi:hypothetical protein
MAATMAPLFGRQCADVRRSHLHLLLLALPLLHGEKGVGHSSEEPSGSCGCGAPSRSAGVAADDLNAAVLAGLQRATTPVDGVQTPPQILDPDTLEMLRANIVAGRFDIGIYTNDGVERVRLTAGDAPLGSIVDPQVLQDAGAVGRLEVPLWMRTPEGGMDVEMMIFSLVQTSLLEDPDPAHRDAAIGMSRKIFAASNARTQTVDGNRVYTVRHGDSLAYIALQFYGRPDAFDSILDANRDTLQSPDEIQIGQRLIIPS